MFIGVIMLTPVLIRFANATPRRIELSLLGSPVAMEITGNWLTVAMLTALSCMGTNAIIRAHPRMSRPDPPRTFTYWILPGFMGLTTGLLLVRAPTWPLWWAALLLTGSAITLVVSAEFATVDPLALGYARSRLILNVVGYALACSSFALIYGTRGRTLVTAPAIALVGFILGFELLNTTEVRYQRSVLYAFLTALILGECAWALNYWRLSAPAGGMLLLLVFYGSVGISQQLFLERVTRRTLLEFALVAALAFVIILRLG